MDNKDTTGITSAGTGAHITGADETETFTTDEPPTSRTPSSGSSNLGINTNGGNRGDSPQPLLARVHAGMAVVDSEGEQAGTVTAVQMPGTAVHPDAPAGIAEELVDVGYIRVDGSGFLSNDTYAAGDQIADTSDDVVSLRVRREDLIRAS